MNKRWHSEVQQWPHVEGGCWLVRLDGREKAIDAAREEMLILAIIVEVVPEFISSCTAHCVGWLSLSLLVPRCCPTVGIGLYATPRCKVIILRKHLRQGSPEAS